MKGLDEAVLTLGKSRFEKSSLPRPTEGFCTRVKAALA